MYRLIKRYIVSVVIVFCLFWLCLDLMWIQWKKEDVKYVKPMKNFHKEQPPVEKEQNYREKIPTIEHQKERQKKHIKNGNIIRTEHIVHTTTTTTEKTTTSDNLVLIDYFKQFYRYSLNPQPGSAGMEGAGVKNSVNEKPLEDIGFKNYSFNQLSSSKISLERSVPDNRDDA